MHRTQRATILGLLILSSLGCDKVKSLYRRYTGGEGVVGTWRQAENENGEHLTFGADGSYRATFNPDPRLPPDTIETLKAMEKTPATYRRQEDTIVIRYDMRSLNKELGPLGLTDPTAGGPTMDLVCKYKLSGDDLELTIKGKNHRYVRVR